jgi:hypothetical protein
MKIILRDGKTVRDLHPNVAKFYVKKRGATMADDSQSEKPKVKTPKVKNEKVKTKKKK